MEADALDLVGQVAKAALAGDWRMVAAAGLVLFVWAARRYAVKLVPWFATDEGGAGLVLLCGFAATLATSISTGAALGIGTVWAALQTSFVAAGGWTVGKRLLRALWAWLKPKVFRGGSPPAAPATP